MFLEEGRENMPIFHLRFKRALGKDGCAKSDEFSGNVPKGGEEVIFNSIYPSRLHNLPPTLEIISIKHVLARSCIQFWPKLGDEGDKI